MVQEGQGWYKLGLTQKAFGKLVYRTPSTAVKWEFV